MNFALSKQADPNKIFLVQRSELEGRLDPRTYHPHRMQAIQRLEEGKFPAKRLRAITSFAKTITKETSESDTYVGLENIESNTGVFIKSLQKETISSALVFKKGQVLFPKLRPYLNKVFYATFDGISSTEFHVLDSDEIENKYLASFLGLNIVVLQTTLLMSGNTLPRLQTEDIKNLLVPIPPKNIQLQIIEKMDAAYLAKKQKEAEAERLLASIDDYLLAELGISLPAEAENTIQNRIFTRHLSDVSGERFDPDYYQVHYELLSQSFQNSTFKCKSLKDVAHAIANGNTPASTDYSETETKHAIIKVGSYEGEFISLDKVAYTKTAKIKKAKKQDIFVLSAAHQASYVGRFLKFLADEPVENTSFVGELICIRANTDICEPVYLFSLLSTEPYKILLNREKTGQTSHIYPKDIKHIQIPLPPLPKQQEVAAHITAIRNQAKQLQAEAKAGLEQAKVEIDAIILGDAA